MMRKSVKRPLVFALFVFVVGFGVARGEVKLRIYMKDGTLQSGNLVTEGASSFVILAKDGRVEVPKNQIMFVNGKTLIQWEAQPIKNYQTEIIPSEVPNPAFVNDKAAPPPPLTPYSPIKGVIPKGDEVARPPEVEPTPEPAQTVEPKSGGTAKPLQEGGIKSDTTAKANELKPEASSGAGNLIVASIPKPHPKPHKKIARKKAPVMVAAGVETKKAGSESAAVKPGPKTFSREEMSEYHYNQAVAFLNANETGQALAELHLAAILNRGSEKAVLLLGKTYFKEGVFSKAEKFLKNPVLRKNEEAKTLLATVAKAVLSRERGSWVLMGGAGAGFFALAIPLIILTRRLRGISPKGIISKEEEREEIIKEEVAAVPALALNTKEIKKEIVDLVNQVAEASIGSSRIETPPAAEGPKEIPVQKEVLASNVKPVPELKPAPEEKPAPQEKIVPEKKPVSEEKPFEETKPPLSPSTAELIKKLERPVEKPQIVPEPFLNLPEPVANGIKPAEPEKVTFKSVQPSAEELLERASLVDSAVQIGNESAADGDLIKAEREYRTAIALNPDCLSGYIGLGFICFMHGQWEMALEFYVKALALNPESPDAHYGIGRVLLETKRESEAVPELQRALHLDPTFTDARDTLTYLGKLA